MTTNTTLLMQTCNIPATQEGLKNLIIEAIKIQLLPIGISFLIILGIFFIFGIFNENLGEGTYWIAFFLLMIGIIASWIVYFTMMFWQGA